MTPIPSQVEVLVLGAGPTGVEAALAARSAGFATAVFERGQVGESMRRWGHVRLFSPWSMNRSAFGERTLTAENVSLEPPEDLPTGSSFVERYLEPLTRSPLLSEVVHCGVEAIAVTRRGVLKGDFIGDPHRADHPFRVLWSRDGRTGVTESRVVIDATGVYRQPNWAGNGGIPAIGERASEAFIERHLPDITGADGKRFRGRHTVLIGSGYSAATALRELIRVRRESPETRVTWVIGPKAEPATPIPDDPLPERAELTNRTLALVADPPSGFELKRGLLEEISQTTRGVALRFQGVADEFVVDAHRVLSLVGYHPDASLLRELQVHHCYATDGLMKVSAELFSQTAGGGLDCLALPAGSAETLRNPEPNLFVVGSKAYGRFSHYLMRTGMAQVEAILSLLTPPTIPEEPT